MMTRDTGVDICEPKMSMRVGVVDGEKTTPKGVKIASSKSSSFGPTYSLPILKHCVLFLREEIVELYWGVPDCVWVVV